MVSPHGARGESSWRLRPTNPSVCGVARGSRGRLAGGGFDLRQSVAVMASRTYQLTHLPNSGNVDDGRTMLGPFPSRIEAEQLLDSIAMSVGAWPKSSNQPLGTRAGQIAGGLAPADGAAISRHRRMCYWAHLGSLNADRLRLRTQQGEYVRQSFVMWSVR